MTIIESCKELVRRCAAERWALVPMRVVIGYGFAAHGYAKLARGPDNFATILDAIGVPAPGPMAWVTSLLELLGGIALMLGASVAQLSVPLGAVMATAMVAVHLPYGFSSVRLKAMTASGAAFGPVGYELNLVYMAGLVALALGRTSPLSVDRWLERRRARSR
jgi:putative oxidoreductase